MPLEYTVGQDGRRIDGDVGHFIDALMRGAQLIFVAASNAQRLEVPQEGLNDADALVESICCRSFLVVPELQYFAGILGPLHCAIQLPESYVPLHLNSQPIYYFQAGDSANHQSVRHFFTHPGWPSRPSRTGSYDPLIWRTNPIYKEVLYVDDQGHYFHANPEEIGNAVVRGHRQQVMVRNLFSDVVAQPFSHDYWVGFELDLVQYYPGSSIATTQVYETLLLNIQVPLTLDNCSEDSLLISSTGNVAHVIRAGHHPEMFETMMQGSKTLLARETRFHLTEGRNTRRKEIKWFVEKV